VPGRRREGARGEPATKRPKRPRFVTEGELDPALPTPRFGSTVPGACAVGPGIDVLPARVSTNPLVAHEPEAAAASFARGSARRSGLRLRSGYLARSCAPRGADVAPCLASVRSRSTLSPSVRAVLSSLRRRLSVEEAEVANCETKRRTSFLSPRAAAAARCSGRCLPVRADVVRSRSALRRRGEVKARARGRP